MFEEYKNRRLAITMWDISWLELHEKGEAFEDWTQRILELKERGYDAVRIDPYVHLLSIEDGREEFLLTPVWADYGWGALKPYYIKNIWNKLVEFLKICKENHILAAFSAWYRCCEQDSYVSHITDGKKLAQIWIALLDGLKKEGLLDVVLYVDFCNEYPLWAEFLPQENPLLRRKRDDKEIVKWTKQCVKHFKEKYPDIPVTFSICSEFYRLDGEDFSDYDFFEPHIWIDSDGDGRFEDSVNRALQGNTLAQEELFKLKKTIYEEGKEYWDEVLHQQIQRFGRLSRKWKKPLITTECWAIIFYKDSGIGWEWIKDICEKGVEYAVEEGCYAAIATSNFCSPQFKGMWSDVQWHKKMTANIHNEVRKSYW